MPANRSEEINKHSEYMHPTIFSFFSGSGFLDLGFELSGYNIAYVNEYHKPFLDAYIYSRYKMDIPSPKYGYFNGSIDDCLHKIDEYNRLQNAIIEERKNNKLIGFIGGPPCPDFSVAGKNKGKDGDNGRLSQSYIDLICQFKPDFFIFENVKGLYRTVKHREFFEKLKLQLSQAGYVCTENLINSIGYGVAQDRERIILFGMLNIEAEDIKKFNWNSYIIYPDALSHNWPTTETVSLHRDKPIDIIEELTIEYWFNKNEVKTHPNALHQFKAKAGLEKFKSIDEGDDKKKSYKRLHRWRYSPTAAYGNNEVHIHPYLPRRLSAAEALAIQSLPKEFELPSTMTLTNMFKTIGNGVPFLAAKGIAKTILDFIEEIKVSK